MYQPLFEAHSELSRTSETKNFVKIVNSFEAYRGSEYASLSFSFAGEVFTQKSHVSSVEKNIQKGLPQLTPL